LTRDESVADPGWVEALAEMIGRGKLDPVDRMVPLPLEVALTDAAEAFANHAPHRRTSSLIVADLRAAIGDSRNPFPAALVGPDGKPPQSLRALLHDSESVLSDPELKSAAINSMRKAVEHLVDPAALALLWDEVVSRFHSSRVTWERRIWLMDRLRTAWEIAGRDWSAAARQISAVLRGDAYTIHLLRGDTTEDDLESPPTLALEERLRLCRDLIGGAGRRGDCIVYLTFTSADLADEKELSVGSGITFYAAGFLRELIEAEPLDERLPTELRPAPRGGFLRLDDDDEVWARVALDGHLIDSAVESAVERAIACVRYASLYSAWVWRMREGHHLYVDGESVGSRVARGFVDEPPPALHGPHARGSVARALAAQPSEFADRIASGDATLLSLTHLLRTFEGLSHTSPEVRVLSAPRILERVALLVGVREWPDLLRSHVAPSWTAGSVRHTVADDIYRCLELEWSRHSGDVYDETTLGDIIAASTAQDGMIDLPATLPRLAQVANCFAMGRSRRLIASDLSADTADGQSAIRRLDRFGSQFEALVDRFERSRHGLMHGWPVEPHVLDSVGSFAVEVTAQSIHLAIQGVLDGGNPSGGFASANAEAEQLRTILGSASDHVAVGLALFPRPESQ
jgi:hypothetical protein